MSNPALAPDPATEAALAAVPEASPAPAESVAAPAPADSARETGVSRYLKPGSPLFGYALIAFTGLAGVIANDNDTTYALLHWSLHRPLHWPAVGLVALALFTAALADWERRVRKRQEVESAAEVRQALARSATATAAQAEAEKLRREAEIRRDAMLEELQARSARIDENQQRAPPPQFMLGFLEAFEATHSGHLLVLRTPIARLNPEIVAESIRTVLFSLARLVQIFEGARDVTYTSNLMLFHPADRLNGAVLKRLEPTLRFAGDSVDVHKLAGVLELRCELSATTSSKEGNIHDTQLVPFSLPVPMNCQTGNGRWALPGAPTAFCRRGTDVVVNVLTIAQRCLLDGAPKYIADQVAAHFEGDEARHIRSFVSVPLVRSNVGTNERPYGVVNVNCSVTGILENSRRQETILPYLRTMAYMLPPMLDIYAAVQRAQTTSRGRRKSRQGP